MKTCRANGCDRKAHSHDLCHMHYQRERKNGHYSISKRSGRRVNARGYVMLLLPKHPLAGSAGYVQEHRKVLHDKIGDGSHPCFYCDRPLHWSTEKRQPPDAITVDHLNNIKSDNSPNNLVPACMRCNLIKGATPPHYTIEQIRQSVRTNLLLRQTGEENKLLVSQITKNWHG